MKILICHEGAIGDFILSIPAIRLIKNKYGGPAGFLGRDFVPELFGPDGLFERHYFSGAFPFSSLFAQKKSSWAEAAALLAGYEKAFIFTNNPGSEFVCNMKGLVPEVVAIRQRPANMGPHAAEFQARQVGGDAFFPPLDNRAVKKRQVVIHPGSGSKAKRWPLEKYFGLIEKLASVPEDVTFILIAGPAEEDLAADLISHAAHTRGCSALIAPSFTSLREALEGSLLYVGNDSGVTHLAAALGIKTVAIFGPTDFRLWRPWGKWVRVVHHETGCSPCAEAVRRSCGEMKCLEGIGVEEVFYSCISVLTSARMEE